jgi:hypothetical protein
MKTASEFALAHSAHFCKLAGVHIAYIIAFKKEYCSEDIGLSVSDIALIAFYCNIAQKLKKE